MEKTLLHAKVYAQDALSTPLLVFHGLFGMLDNWGTFGREMSDTYPVHLLDLRNHGKSFHSEEMSHELMAEDILYYMNQNKIDKAHLLGHSLGGKAVMQFALTYPERVQKLIVVDIAPKAYPPHHQGIIKALESIDFQKVTSRKEVEDQLKGFIRELPVIQFLLKNLHWVDTHRLGWRFNLPALSRHYSQYVGRAVRTGVYPGQTLFISGADSHYILPQDALGLRQQFPAYTLETIEGAGHWVQAEKPKEFLKVVRDFLS